MGEQEGAVEVEGDELLPVRQGQLLGSGRRLVDHRAAANRVDQNVDPAMVALHLRDQLVNLRESGELELMDEYAKSLKMSDERRASHGSVT